MPLLPFTSVLIESDWNLKYIWTIKNGRFLIVLIESDWNLKYSFIRSFSRASWGINRIRLEFKESSAISVWLGA